MQKRATGTPGELLGAGSRGGETEDAHAPGDLGPHAGAGLLRVGVQHAVDQFSRDAGGAGRDGLQHRVGGLRALGVADDREPCGRVLAVGLLDGGQEVRVALCDAAVVARGGQVRRVAAVEPGARGGRVADGDGRAAVQVPVGEAVRRGAAGRVRRGAGAADLDVVAVRGRVGAGGAGHEGGGRHRPAAGVPGRTVEGPARCPTACREAGGRSGPVPPADETPARGGLRPRPLGHTAVQGGAAVGDGEGSRARTAGRGGRRPRGRPGLERQAWRRGTAPRTTNTTAPAPHRADASAEGYAAWAPGRLKTCWPCQRTNRGSTVGRPGRGAATGRPWRSSTARPAAPRATYSSET